ncbi:hypothetical protein CAMRE0001_1356 [Campylobacter rectus RM3267]|uniref:Uncharacterized protein n=1 Tax=Campylobacter rectus RM3267 TaxID=553218 RepID=B9D042_CAMRE|nr:hypothetical protein CAMRE0001_1356 [Campylobacter rectus RM3267]
MFFYIYGCKKAVDSAFWVKFDSLPCGVNLFKFERLDFV